MLVEHWMCWANTDSHDSYCHDLFSCWFFNLSEKLLDVFVQMQIVNICMTFFHRTLIVGQVFFFMSFYLLDII